MRRGEGQGKYQKKYLEPKQRLREERSTKQVQSCGAGEERWWKVTRGPEEGGRTESERRQVGQ